MKRDWRALAFASKEFWVRSYDHEVIAQTVIKPFCGVDHDAPGDAAVIAPIHGGTQGAVISNGIAPRYSDIDAYSMAASCVDEALRNAVCVGVDLDMVAGLDNFCWPDPVVSEKTPDGRYKLAQLVRANRAIDDICRAYRLPCISGKDSMKNDVTMHGEKISVPPTILFSLIGNHNDVRKAVSSDFKQTGDHIYLLGETHQELGASEIAYMFRDECSGGIGGRVPEIDAERNLSMYRALTKAMSQGLVASAHDCSDGGLAVALAECCFGTNSGAALVSPRRFFALAERGDLPKKLAWVHPTSGAPIPAILMTWALASALTLTGTFKELAVGSIAKQLKQEMEDFRPFMPVVTALRNPGMRDRHWAKFASRSKLVQNSNKQKGEACFG